MKKILFSLILALVLTAAFPLGISHMDRQRRQEGVRRLEEALRQGAVTCYALDGVYPADLACLLNRCGLIYDQDRYVVHYQLPASNLMPDITVLELP